MRMWNIHPSLLCNKHLLGEHVEMHMFVGAINKGTSITGFINKGLVEVNNIKSRHRLLVIEMIKRGMNHKSELPEVDLWNDGYVDINKSIDELKRRCPDCLKRINGSVG